MRKLVIAATAAAACLTPSTAAHSAAASGAGEITWYDPSRGGTVKPLGACGNEIGPDDLKASVSYQLFDGYWGSNPNHNPICGRKIQINYQGRSVIATIADRCHACEGENDVELTAPAFKELAPLEQNRLFGAAWDWV